MWVLYRDCSGGWFPPVGGESREKGFFPERSIIVDRLFCVDMMGFSVGANTS